MATYPIRQLADNGGTAPFVPVTAPEAVQFPDGSNLNTFIGSVATIESNPVAANHAVGEFLCINGQVYEVIDAITAGDSISLGENVQVTNLGSQITALNNGLTEWTDIPITVNVTIGSSVTITAKKRNGILKFYVEGRNTAQVAAGGNLLQATIVGNIGLFERLFYVLGYYKSSPLIAYFDSVTATSANLIVRVTGTDAVGVNTVVNGAGFTTLV